MPDTAAPAAFLAALRSNKKALASFERLPPSHRNEYIKWITEAKRDDTRQRRIQQAVEKISAPKTLSAKADS